VPSGAYLTAGNCVRVLGKVVKPICIKNRGRSIIRARGIVQQRLCQPMQRKKKNFWKAFTAKNGIFLTQNPCKAKKKTKKKKKEIRDAFDAVGVFPAISNYPVSAILAELCRPTRPRGPAFKPLLARADGPAAALAG